MLSADVSRLQPDTLPPFLRVLLVMDGTVTRSLEAFFWEPIDVEVLIHDSVPSEQSYPQIGIDYGERIILRRVILRGRVRGTAYAFAQSVIAEKRISSELCDELVMAKKGLGEVLLSMRQRTFREILSVRQAEAREWAAELEVDPAASVLVRQYTICHETEPAILVEEIFPQSRYESSDRHT